MMNASPEIDGYNGERATRDIADGGDTLFAHAIGSQAGRDVFAIGDREDTADAVLDSTHHAAAHR